MKWITRSWQTGFSKKIEDVEWDEDGNNNYEDDIAEWLDEVVGENK